MIKRLLKTKALRIFHTIRPHFFVSLTEYYLLLRCFRSYSTTHKTVSLPSKYRSDILWAWKMFYKPSSRIYLNRFPSRTRENNILLWQLLLYSDVLSASSSFTSILFCPLHLRAGNAAPPSWRKQTVSDSDSITSFIV